MLFFASYIFLYAWYVPIAKGPRFTNGLYLPLLFGLLFTINKLATMIGVFHIRQFEIDVTKLMRLFNVMIFIFVLGDFFFHAPMALSKGYFGG